MVLILTRELSFPLKLMSLKRLLRYQGQPDS